MIHANSALGTQNIIVTTPFALAVSPSSRLRQSKISEGFADSITEFEAENSINKSIFRHTPSLLMVEEATPR